MIKLMVIALLALVPYGLCRPSIAELPDKELQGLPHQTDDSDGEVAGATTSVPVGAPVQAEIVCMKKPNEVGGLPVVRRMPDDSATGVWTTYTSTIDGQSVSTFSVDSKTYADLSKKCASIGFETVQPVDQQHPDFNAFLVDKSLADYYHYSNGTLIKDGTLYKADTTKVKVTCMKPSTRTGGLPNFRDLDAVLDEGEWTTYKCKNSGGTVFAFAVQSSTYNDLLDQCKTMGFETVQPTDDEHQGFNGFLVQNTITQRYHYVNAQFKKEEMVAPERC
jgi:hypothetical protein